ncbi:oxidoreductase [alpha proteobacterium U9-1i]|nr:oxidoreductase [alpha proteobacterium U9-1i]
MSALIRLTTAGPAAVLPKDGRVFTPLAHWLVTERRGDAVLLANTDDPLVLAGHIGAVDAIAVEFPKPTDGRGFSIARLLRDRVGYRGELRAVGAVAHDQLTFMRRCGFDTFDLREGEDPAACLKAFSEISVLYQGASDDPRPLFRRREEALKLLTQGGMQ